VKHKKLPIHTIKYIDDLGRVIRTEIMMFREMHREGEDVVLDHMKYKVIGVKIKNDAQSGVMFIYVRKV